jgi:hypothetical protein
MPFVRLAKGEADSGRFRVRPSLGVFFECEDRIVARLMDYGWPLAVICSR